MITASSLISNHKDFLEDSVQSEEKIDYSLIMILTGSWSI